MRPSRTGGPSQYREVVSSASKVLENPDASNLNATNPQIARRIIEQGPRATTAKANTSSSSSQPPSDLGSRVLPGSSQTGYRATVGGKK